MAKRLTKDDRSRIVQDARKMRTEARETVIRVREATDLATTRLDVLRIKSNELK